MGHTCTASRAHSDWVLGLGGQLCLLLGVETLEHRDAMRNELGVARRRELSAEPPGAALDARAALLVGARLVSARTAGRAVVGGRERGPHLGEPVQLLVLAVLCHLGRRVRAEVRLPLHKGAVQSRHAAQLQRVHAGREPGGRVRVEDLCAAAAQPARTRASRDGLSTFGGSCAPAHLPRDLGAQVRHLEDAKRPLGAVRVLHLAHRADCAASATNESEARTSAGCGGRGAQRLATHRPRDRRR